MSFIKIISFILQFLFHFGTVFYFLILFCLYSSLTQKSRNLYSWMYLYAQFSCWDESKTFPIFLNSQRRATWVNLHLTHIFMGKVPFLSCIDFYLSCISIYMCQNLMPTQGVRLAIRKAYISWIQSGKHLNNIYMFYK